MASFLNSTPNAPVNITTNAALPTNAAMIVNWFYTARFWLAFGSAAFILNILEAVSILRIRKYKSVFGLTLFSLCIADIFGGFSFTICGLLRLIESSGREQSLQILTFLYAVCHVVVVVMDHFTELSLLKFLKSAEMLKPSSVAHSGQDGSSTTNAEDLDEYFPHVVFTYNRCGRESFSADNLQQMCQVTDKFFQHSRLKSRGSASIFKANLLPCCKLKPFYDYQDLNLFVLPEIEDKDNKFDKEQIRSQSTYSGHPSFLSLVSSLRSQLLSMPRQHLTHHSLTERSWFHYAARTWDAVKKSPLLSEYQRLLTT
eukprot:Seg2092.3 transcript_id=Seg2092.3/GoldUCD/mRNA.D3Y31 product="Protein SMG9" protein_id=Seg2092.3/GoldUCD/D3Y31